MEFHLKAAQIFVIFDWNLEDTKLSVISLRLAVKCCGASAQDFSGEVQIELLASTSSAGIASASSSARTRIGFDYVNI